MVDPSYDIYNIRRTLVYFYFCLYV